jgi:hypothetical protein
LFRKVRPAPHPHPCFLAPGALGRYHNSQPLPPLGPSSFQHLTAAGGCHPNKKTMSPFAAHVARLIGSFHKK